MLTAEEKKITRASLEMALEAGASKARASLSKNTMSIVATLDGEVDKVTGCLDRSISLNLFVDGRYGTFSTNKLDEKSLRAFIGKAVGTTRMLAADACRDLPDPARTAKDASGGNELGICDPAWSSVTPDQRIAYALNNGVKTKSGKGWKLISEEGEYSDSQYFNYVVDTQGLEVLHSETSFEFFTELTIQDSKGRKYSGGWWEAAPLLRDFHPEKVAPAALQEAVMQIGPKSCPGGKYRAVIDSEVSQKVLNPVLNALNAFNIQQKNSFLLDKAGEKVFSEHLTILDCARAGGETGSRLFDSEGVATTAFPIIDKGVVTRYFVNTYIAGKTGMAPTIEDATRPKVLPFGGCKTREDVLRKVGDGILVTGFNGGNSNSSTGDFSYGIEGFAFRDGKIVHPVREVLVTGNFITLWNNLVAVADDARLCMSKLIPTLAFENVDCNA